MPLHDWTCVYSGIYHDFHNAWITHLQEALNRGLLPKPYYALGDGLASAEAQVHGAQEADLDAIFYLARRRTLVIRHETGDRIVALIEILSPAVKHSAGALQDFADKILAALRDGIHVIMIDPFPPSRHDPEGIHGLLWRAFGQPLYDPPADCSLTLAAYCANSSIDAYVEPTRVGLPLVDMPLFLTKTHYIRTQLEATYMQAWAGVPKRWQRVIDA